jgi:hypothetical protein
MVVLKVKVSFSFVVIDSMMKLFMFIAVLHALLLLIAISGAFEMKECDAFQWMYIQICVNSFFMVLSCTLCCISIIRILKIPFMCACILGLMYCVFAVVWGHMVDTTGCSADDELVLTNLFNIITGIVYLIGCCLIPAVQDATVVGIEIEYKEDGTYAGFREVWIAEDTTQSIKK